MTTDARTQIDLYSALRERYPLPKFAFAVEVPDGTSVDKVRTCDALAIGCWKSVGVSIIGHEIKRSRSDWQKEMQDPSKAEAWKQYCHEWYLVALKGVAKLEELPPSWGLIEPAGSGLKIRKPCEINRNPLPLPTRVVAALARRFQNTSELECATAKAYQRGYDAGVEQAKKWNATDAEIHKRQLANAKAETDRLEKTIKLFGDLTASLYQSGAGVAMSKKLPKHSRDLKCSGRHGRCKTSSN